MFVSNKFLRFCQFFDTRGQHFWFLSLNPKSYSLIITVPGRVQLRTKGQWIFRGIVMVILLLKCSLNFFLKIGWSRQKTGRFSNFEFMVLWSKGFVSLSCGIYIRLWYFVIAYLVIPFYKYFLYGRTYCFGNTQTISLMF